MRVVALISGGKDSCFNMMQCVAHGHQIVALANLKPHQADELDSFMYQTVGHHAIHLYADAMSTPLYQHTIQGSSKQIGEVYNQDDKDEVEDLFHLLAEIKEKIPFEGVSVGAILSNYQRVRVENVCSRLGVTALSYLWRREQTELLKEMIDSRIDALVIKVAALGLKPSVHLGMSIKDLFPHMLKLKEKFGLNVCGEGGEYETFTVDCPLFKKKIVIDEMKQVVHSDDYHAQVCYLNIHKAHLENKQKDEMTLGCSIDFLKDDIETISTLKSGYELDLTNFQQEENRHAQCQGSNGPVDQADSIFVRESPSGLIWISGIVGMQGDSVEAVARDVMDKLQGALKSLDLLLETHSALVHIYVKNMEEYAKINAVYKTYFKSNPPARVCVESCLPDDVLLQVDCLCSRNKKETMHVQSLSHWAPANIGPYSQTVKVGPVVFLSGSIGLVPCSGSLVSGGIVEEGVLSLRHVEKILKVVLPPEGSLDSILAGFCYVSSRNFLPVVKEMWTRLSRSADACPNLMMYIVVSHLPKSAAVEWHFIAHKSKHSRKYSKHHPAHGNMSMVTETCWSEEDGVGAFNYSIECKEASLSEVFQSLVSDIVWKLESCSCTWEDLLIIRCFHQGVHIDTSLQKVFQDILSSKSLSSPALVFLPVLHLQDNVNFAVSCLVKTQDKLYKDYL